MSTRRQQLAPSPLGRHGSRLRRAACTLALAVACTVAWIPAAAPFSHAQAATNCDPTITPAANDTAAADFSSDANIVSNFSAARQAEGCATPLTLPGNYDSLSPQQQMLALFNLERTDRGLGALRLDSTLLSQIALNHSHEFAQYGYFDHPSPINQPSTGTNRWNVNPAIAQAFHSEGENIAAGQSTVASAVYGFMYRDSASAWGHRHNILGSYDWVGIGIDRSTATPYYTDDFLGDSPASPYTPPATVDTTAPSLDAPTLNGSVATVTNVADQGDATAITAVVFYTGAIVETGHTFNTVPAANQGNGTWTATLPAGATGVLHAVAVDASGNFTDVAVAGTTTGGTGGNPPTGGTGACTTDGTVCLTGFTASNAAPAAGASVTLTASTNIDPGPTIWYMDIVDENGTILTSCGHGTSCPWNVSSASAATHRYTAKLSTSPTSISGGGPASATVAVTWAAAAGGNPPAGGGTTTGCTTDGAVCLTSFTASNAAPAAGASVTLTASTNIDPGPTIWFADIVDENGAIVLGCGSGTSCTTTVSSASAATHQYTAKLSTSKTSISAGAPTSATVAVTWAAAAGGNPPAGGGTTTGCTTDGAVCLTSFTASNAAPAAGASVTLTASTNIDPGPTIWYMDIVDENGAILMGCGSGTSCTTTVSSASAATHQYTAKLSTSPTSISGGGPTSATVAVTWN